MGIFQSIGPLGARVQFGKKKTINENELVSRRTSLARPLKFVFDGYFIYKMYAEIVEVEEDEFLRLLSSMIVTCIPYFYLRLKVSNS